MRHILLMYPTMIALEKAEEDVREYIENKLQQAKIVVYEIGLKNIVAHDLRDQLTLSSLLVAPSGPTVD